MSGIPTRGSLAELPLPRLLIELYRERFTGALKLTRERTQKRFLLQEGAPLQVESNVAGETLTAQLLDAGTITAIQRHDIEDFVKRKKSQEGLAILSLKLLDTQDLFVALKEQLRRRAVECFGWPHGQFELESGVAVPKEAQPFRTDPYVLIQDGLAAHWPADRLLEGLMGQLNHYPRATPLLAEISRRLPNDPDLEALVAGLDGTRTLGKALGSGGNLPHVLAALWLMDATDAIRYESEPLTPEGEEDAPREIEIQVSGGETAGERAAGATQERAKTESEAANPKAEKMRSEVLERHAQLPELNHYELLDVEHDVTAAVIKKAYFSAAKRYHPDALNRLKLDGIKTEAGEVFSQIAKAYEVLSDADARKEYDASLLDDGPQIDASRLAQAETFYRKGEILARMGDFRNALQFLQNAVDVWPDETVYQCDLGWAFFRKSPPEHRPACDHLRQAIELQIDSAVAHYRLGLVLRDMGEEEAAEVHISRAKEIDPNVS